MIYTYSYYHSNADKLNEFVLSYFNRIEFETGDFSTNFFEKEFYDNLVSHHTGILLKQFKTIYETTKAWRQPKRTALCNAIRDSNKIEEICAGKIKFSDFSDLPSSLVEILIQLFKQLYNDVLFGQYFSPHYGNRKDHYHNFLKHSNNEFDWCPSCGIRPMHRYTEDITDQYDHYLPKDIYPFSSVNFKNLIPICNDCNSIQTKSNDDILIHTGKVFYPFDRAHKTIKIDISMEKDDTDLDKIEWKLDYNCEVGKEDELVAWKSIYKIEGRHNKYCKGSFRSWYKNYFEDFTDLDTVRDNPDESVRKRNYLRVIKKSNLFEYQCLTSFLKKNTEKAIQAAKLASRY